MSASGRYWLGLAWIAFGLNAHAADTAGAAVSASNQFLTAYDSMTMADWLKQQGLQEDAAESYVEALHQFEKLAREFPAWQTDLVAYRRRYCADQLAVLGEGARASPPAPAALPPPSAAPATAATNGPAAPSQTAPEPGAAEIQQAVHLERALDLAAAVDRYAAILTEQPGHREALKGLLRCYLRQGAMAQARARIQQGLIIPATETELQTMIAMVDCYDGRFSAAVQRLTPVLQEHPAAAPTHVVMGIAQMGMGRVDVAETEMKKALSFNARLGEAYYNLARISLARNPNDLAAVKAHYFNALKYGVDPDPALEKRLRP